MSKRLFVFAFLAAVAGIISCDDSHKRADNSHAAREVNITILDDAPYHVHPPGTQFTIAARVESSEPTVIHYQWQDFRGQALSDPAVIKSGELSTIHSPDSKVGYYGLVFRANDDTVALPNRQPGEPREYGFVILAPRTVSDRQIDPSSPFGMVHADIQDPYLPVWVKTATWKTYSTRWWLAEMQKRRKLGKLELPLVAGKEWDSDDTKPISSQQLAELEAQIRQYFAADADVIYWELGIEENLQSRFGLPYYWNNLEAKARVVRQAADKINPEIKLIYQIAELDSSSIQKLVARVLRIAGLRTPPIQQFLESTAAEHFDILSLHPYAWPDFPSPEKWMPEYLQNTRSLMKQNNIQGMPIWFTEVGAPHHGNHPDEFFGYPKSGKAVKGLSRKEAVDYMIKTHVLALHAGVKKIFWYNYKDRGNQRAYAEAHFGIRDYWGFPKPVYSAYINLLRCLSGKKPVQARQLPGNLWLYEFEGKNEHLLVTWTYPVGVRLTPLESLKSELTPDDVIEITDAVGTPLSLTGNIIRITGEPLYLITKKD
jgi:hypothetical protein